MGSRRQVAGVVETISDVSWRRYGGLKDPRELLVSAAESDHVYYERSTDCVWKQQQIVSFFRLPSSTLSPTFLSTSETEHISSAGNCRPDLLKQSVQDFPKHLASVKLKVPGGHYEFPTDVYPLTAPHVASFRFQSNFLIYIAILESHAPEERHCMNQRTLRQKKCVSSAEEGGGREGKLRSCGAYKR